MTTLTFQEEQTAPMDEPTPDVFPPVSDVDDPCKECGRQIDTPYGGRGRRPTKCLECKGKSKSPAVRATKVTGTNAVLAAQATEAICSIDGMMALGARIVGFTATAEIIEEADEVFRLRVNAALLNSPDMSRKILRYGSKAGDSAFFIAIALHIATIAPVFMGEAKQKKAEKAERLAQENEE